MSNILGKRGCDEVKSAARWYKAGVCWVLPKEDARKVLNVARTLLRPDRPPQYFQSRQKLEAEKSPSPKTGTRPGMKTSCTVCGWNQSKAGIELSDAFRRSRYPNSLPVITSSYRSRHLLPWSCIAEPIYITSKKCSQYFWNLDRTGAENDCLISKILVDSLTAGICESVTFAL